MPRGMMKAKDVIRISESIDNELSHNKYNKHSYKRPQSESKRSGYFESTFDLLSAMEIGYLVNRGVLKISKDEIGKIEDILSIEYPTKEIDDPVYGVFTRRFIDKDVLEKFKDGYSSYFLELKDVSDKCRKIKNDICEIDNEIKYLNSKLGSKIHNIFHKKKIPRERKILNNKKREKIKLKNKLNKVEKKEESLEEIFNIFDNNLLTKDGIFFAKGKSFDKYKDSGDYMSRSIKHLSYYLNLDEESTQRVDEYIENLSFDLYRDFTDDKISESVILVAQKYGEDVAKKSYDILNKEVEDFDHLSGIVDETDCIMRVAEEISNGKKEFDFEYIPAVYIDGLVCDKCYGRGRLGNNNLGYYAPECSKCGGDGYIEPYILVKEAELIIESK